MLVQLPLALLEVVARVLLLAILRPHLTLDVIQLAVQLLPLRLTLLDHHLGYQPVHLLDLLLEVIVVCVHGLHLGLVDVLVLGLMSLVSLDLLLLLGCRGIYAHQQ